MRDREGGLLLVVQVTLTLVLLVLPLPGPRPPQRPPLSSKLGTHKTVTARFWPWLAPFCERASERERERARERASSRAAERDREGWIPIVIDVLLTILLVLPLSGPGPPQRPQIILHLRFRVSSSGILTLFKVFYLNAKAERRRNNLNRI